MKTLYKFPKGSNYYNAMWAQISGMADCCTMGVIGRMSGMQQTKLEFTENDAAIIKAPYKKVTRMTQYVMELLPSSPLFSGPPDWLHWAVLEDLMFKATTGCHISQIKAKSVDMHKFDFENNPYHKFWAGQSMRVKTWVISDRNGSYMSHLTELRCNAFKDFVLKHKLGQFDVSEPSNTKTHPNIWVGTFRPDIEKIKELLPSVLQSVNKECESRWKQVEPHVTKAKAVKDEVAKKW